MDTNPNKRSPGSDDLLCRDEVYAIVGCAFEVLKELGHGLNEKPYENALAVEFGLRGFPVDQQRRFNVLYKGVLVADYIPDLIAYGSVIVDAKVSQQITNHERGQMINYLRITGRRVGLILNFAKPKLEWERIVL